MAGCLFSALFASSASAATIQDIAGTYTGSWTNLTFGSTGPALIEIAFADDDATIVFDMGGPVFGGFDPPAVTMLGTVVGGDLVINSLQVSVFGDIAGTVSGDDGSFSFAITNVPGGFIDQVTAQGSIAGGVIDLAYEVHFAGPPGPTNPASGILNAVIPEPGTLALVALGAGCLAFWGRKGVETAPRD